MTLHGPPGSLRGTISDQPKKVWTKIQAANSEVLRLPEVMRGIVTSAIIEKLDSRKRQLNLALQEIVPMYSRCKEQEVHR